MALASDLEASSRRQWHPTPVLSPGKSHGQRSLEGCSPRGRWGSDTTEPLHFHFSLSCIGEGNGNSLQCSCLENPRDRGAWWTAIYGVAQSRTRLERLSSSSSRLTTALTGCVTVRKLLQLSETHFPYLHRNYQQNLPHMIVLRNKWNNTCIALPQS